MSEFRALLKQPQDKYYYIWNNSGNSMLGSYSTDASFIYSYGTILKKTKDGVLTQLATFNRTTRDEPRLYTGFSNYTSGDAIVTENEWCKDAKELIWRDDRAKEYNAIDIDHYFKNVKSAQHLTATFGNNAGITRLPKFDKLEEIGVNGMRYMFKGCSGISQNGLSFPKLASIGQYGLTYAFYGCSGITGSVSFPSLASITITGNGKSEAYNPLYYCFYQCTGITELHFRSELSAQRNYLNTQTLFGGNNTRYHNSNLQILFDL